MHLLVCPSSKRCAVQVLCLLALQVHKLLLVLGLLALEERDFIVHVPCQREGTFPQVNICRARGNICRYGGRGD